MERTWGPIYLIGPQIDLEEATDTGHIYESTKFPLYDWEEQGYVVLVALWLVVLASDATAVAGWLN